MATAKIIINDEVNCRISGLDLDTRKNLVKEFKYFQQGARYQPAYKLGRWDGCVGFFGLGGLTYVNLLERIIPMLDKWGYQIEVEDNRPPIKLEFNKISEDFWGDKTWPDGHRFAGQPIRLRDDQVNAANIFLENPQSIQQISTGAGKCLAGDTLITIRIDEQTAFGKFMVNKLQQEQENNVTIHHGKL